MKLKLHKQLSRVIMAFLPLLAVLEMHGQTVIFSENMGTPSGTTAIAANSFQNSTLIFTGTGDVRATSPSSGYTGASGGGNVLINAIGEFFQISNINTANFSNLVLTVGHHKAATATSNELVIEVSSDGTNYSPLSYTRPSGSGTTGWLLITPSGTIPSTANLRLRFRCTIVSDFRVDDVKLTGTPLATGPTVTTNTASGITTADATLNGSVDANNFSTDITFEYGTTLSYGTSVSASPAALSDDVSTPVSATITGLAPNTLYNFRAVGTVSGTPTNGANEDFYTLANVPGAPSLDNSTTSSIDVSVDTSSENGNSSETVYAIRTGLQYVQLDGTLGNDAVWRTAAEWATITVNGLEDNTLYTFDLKARNGDGIETAFGASDSLSTLENLAANLTLTGELAAYGNVCINGSAFQSFSFDGENLDGSDLIIGALSGYSYSTTQNGTYTSTLNLTYAGNTASQTVWVMFSPTTVSSYDGNIAITGGGLEAPFEVSASGSGINTAVLVATQAASGISSTAATLNATLTEGCSTVNPYGFEYSTIDGFSDGAGTVALSSDLSAGTFSATVSSFEPNTTYYFKAFATDATGTVYGVQQTLLTSHLTAPEVLAGSSIAPDSFIANWMAEPGADGYRLDVSTNPDFALITPTTDLFFSEYIEGSSNNKYLEIYNGTGSTVDLSDYELHLYVNGSVTANNEIQLSGDLEHGATIVYRNGSASIETYPSNAAINFNGDDAIALYKISTASNVDIFGRIGGDPGTAWTASGFSTVNKTLVRKPTVFGGVTVNPPAGAPLSSSFATLSTEWIQFDEDTTSDLGSHTINNTTSLFVPGYENLAVMGVSQIVTGLEEDTTYYYRVRGESANSLSPNSDVITVTTSVASPTFGSITQLATVCDDAEATFNVTGLLAGSTSTITYTIDGGAPQTASDVIADGSGNASFAAILDISNDGQNLTVDSIERTDKSTDILAVSSNNTALLSVLPNQTYFADSDGDGYGDAGISVVDCIAPAGYVIISGDCNDGNAAVNPGATEVGYNLIDDDCDGSVDEGFPPKSTTVGTATCGTILASIDSMIYAGLVAGAQGYQWRVTTVSGPNAGQVQLLNTPLRAMKLTQLTNYSFGATYQIEVAVYFAGFLQPYTPSACTVSTPAAITQLGQCGQTLSTINDAIYANLVPFANGYRFRITDPLNPSNTQTIDRPVRDFKMSDITAFSVQYNKTYQVDVAVRNTDGTYLGFGPICNVTTPLFPTVGLQDAQCDNGIGGPYAVPSMNTPIYAASYPGAISYTFRLTGGGLPVGGVEVTKSLRVFTLNDFAGMGIVPGTTYNVNVRIAFNTSDAAGPYGKTCSLTVPGGVRLVSKTIDATAYPNPFASEFSIELQGSESAHTAVKIYDMTGRLLESSIFDTSEIKLGQSYPAGVYNVIVTQGDFAKTLRVVKR